MTMSYIFAWCPELQSMKNHRKTLVNIYDKLIINLAEIEKNETRLTKEELCEIVDKIKEKEENQND